MPLLPASSDRAAVGRVRCPDRGRRAPEFSPTHPWGCHRRRVADRVVFDHVIAALVHGSGYERLAAPGCSDRTIRRRLGSGPGRASASELLRLALAAYDRMIGLELDDLAVDGAITKAPCGGEVAGRSPVDRGKQGMKRSVACDAEGIPLHLVAARANDHDSPLLEPTLAGIRDMLGPQSAAAGPTMHLDRGYDPAKDPGPAGDPGLPSRHRRQGQARADPGRQALAGRADALVDERLRQAPPLSPRRKVIVDFYLFLAAAHRDPPPDPPRSQSLPLAVPPHHPTPPLTINCRSLLIRALSVPGLTALTEGRLPVGRLLQRLTDLLLASLPPAWSLHRTARACGPFGGCGSRSCRGRQAGR